MASSRTLAFNCAPSQAKASAQGERPARRPDRPWKLPMLAMLALSHLAPMAQPVESAGGMSPQERLDAIRLSLVEASLQTPTKVQSTSWVDSRGGLHEFSVFKNGLKVQGIKVMGFSRDADGQAKATLQLPASDVPPLQPKSLPSAQALPTQAQAQIGSDCSAPVANDRLRHAIRFTLKVSPQAHPVLAAFAPALLHEQWMATQLPAQSWQLVPDLAKPVLNHESTPYERALLGNHADHQPWQASLELSSRIHQPESWGLWNPPRPTLLVRMVLRLTPIDRPGQSRSQEASMQLVLDGEDWQGSSLPQRFSTQIRHQLQQWHRTLDNWLKCEPVTPYVLKAQGQRLILNAGALAGVRVGDEWLVADPTRFPKHLLDQDGASQTLLARVDVVSPNESSLTVLAGPAPKAQAHWRAWPTENLHKGTTAPASSPEPRPGSHR